MPTLASQRPVGCRTTPLWLEEPRLKPLLCRRTAITRSVIGMCSMVSITSSYLQYSKVRGRYVGAVHKRTRRCRGAGQGGGKGA
jgi:hypothetical protein